MGTIDKLPPAPFRQALTAAQSLLTWPWSNWFKKLFEAVDSNQQAIEDLNQGRQL